MAGQYVGDISIKSSATTGDTAGGDISDGGDTYTFNTGAGASSGGVAGGLKWLLIGAVGLVLVVLGWLFFRKRG